MKVDFVLNGKPVNAEFEPGKNLMEYLRSIGLKSVKYGCDFGECGSCTVLIDNLAKNSCLTLMHSLEGKRVETLEALNLKDGFHPLQKAFLDEGAVQCGYCTPGMIMSLEGLCRENGNPDESDVREALAGNLCRCTGYVKPVKAAVVLKANTEQVSK